MPRPLVVLTIGCVASLAVRCSGCCDHPRPPTSTTRAGGAVYAGVGEACSNDSTGVATGCGYGSTTASATCGTGLVCCPKQSGYYVDYFCVASDRCATSSPGDFCTGTRDCPRNYDCVDDYCATTVGAACASNYECTTRHCEDGVCGYPRLDRGPDRSTDRGSDAHRPRKDGAPEGVAVDAFGDAAGDGRAEAGAVDASVAH
jgi:hypothetical protein